jgi:ribonuclease D
METLQQSHESLKNSPVIGVDLEGWLKYNGTLETIQISNVNTVFIFDMVTALKDQELY